MSDELIKRGVCPKCIRHILDIVGKRAKHKWYIIKIHRGDIYTSWRLSDLPHLTNVEKEDKATGTITTNEISPEPLPEEFEWTCVECYKSLKKEAKSRSENKNNDERWLDGLDDWR